MKPMMRYVLVVLAVVAIARSAEATVTVVSGAVKGVSSERAAFAKDAIEQALRMRKITVGPSGEETVVVTTWKLGSYLAIRVERLRNEASLAQAESRAKLFDDDAVLDVTMELVDEIYPRPASNPIAKQAAAPVREAKRPLVQYGAPVMPTPVVAPAQPAFLDTGRDAEHEQLLRRAKNARDGAIALTTIGSAALVTGTVVVAAGRTNLEAVIGGSVTGVVGLSLALGGIGLAAKAARLQREANARAELIGLSITPSSSGVYASAAIRY